MRIIGKVVRGKGIGRELGYPTANLEMFGDPISEASEIGSPRIEPGVYAARVTVGGSTHNAAAVVGVRFEGGKPLVEVLLLDFNGDLYGKELRLELLEKISEIEQFDDQVKLVEKIEDDVEKVRDYFIKHVT